MRAEADIRNFYGATIATDSPYPNLVKLAKHNATSARIDGDLMATGDPSAAERFIVEKLRSFLP